MGNDLIAALKRYEELLQQIDIDDERHEVADAMRCANGIIQQMAREIVQHRREAL